MIISSKINDLNVPFSPANLLLAVDVTNEYLVNLPLKFSSDGLVFYNILNQRNLSGFIGEVFKQAISHVSEGFIPNPHPDGRPDILDLRTTDARNFFHEECFDKSGFSIREKLAPFPFNGVEIKCTIGNIKNASALNIGTPRYRSVTGINYWAHHAHQCNLMGVYYDYSDEHSGMPQIMALIYTSLEAKDWNTVSTGRPDSKKTSNTSLNSLGATKLKRSLVLCTSKLNYIEMFRKIGFDL